MRVTVAALHSRAEAALEEPLRAAGELAAAGNLLVQVVRVLDDEERENQRRAYRLARTCGSLARSFMAALRAERRAEVEMDELYTRALPEIDPREAVSGSHYIAVTRDDTSQLHRVRIYKADTELVYRLGGRTHKAAEMKHRLYGPC